MKKIAFIFVICSQQVFAFSPQEFNKELMQDVREDIKQERYQEKNRDIIRKPASIEREEVIDQKEFQRKNRVNGLHEKW
jgi:hypothetical protein